MSHAYFRWLALRAPSSVLPITVAVVLASFLGCRISPGRIPQALAATIRSTGLPAISLVSPAAPANEKYPATRPAVPLNCERFSVHPAQMRATPTSTGRNWASSPILRCVGNYRFGRAGSPSNLVSKKGEGGSSRPLFFSPYTLLHQVVNSSYFIDNLRPIRRGWFPRPYRL